MPSLTIDDLLSSARSFVDSEPAIHDAALFGVTDGKAVGTYLEHRFQDFLKARYQYQRGNSASGIDFPELGVDMKTTSSRQPQSSCSFKSARQKIYGLGYSLLVFVYEKTDDASAQLGRLNIIHIIFVESQKTADYQTTTGIRQLLDNNANSDDIIAFLQDRRLPVDEIEAERLSEEIIANPPSIGYLTVSNDLQWRLQYGRVIQIAGQTDGVLRLR
jgi:hypothetical protein